MSDDRNLGALPQTDLERRLLAQLAAVTGGLAPDDYLNAWWEWYMSLATRPDRQRMLARSAVEKLLDAWQFSLRAAAGQPLPPGSPELGFAHPAWSLWPFNTVARGYANWASWWREALAPDSAAQDPNLRRAAFAGRLLIDAASPANFLHTNPELLGSTVAQSGHNLVRGLKYWLEDVRSAIGGQRGAGANPFAVGKDVAVTPGKVVFRNRLIELLQYSPQTQQVHAEPVLITPAWIMKYYILDLSPRNSLVRYLVRSGHTVFMISWKNPTAADRELGFDDYVQTGFLDALAAVNRCVPDHKVHAVGYCIGGTLLAASAALLAGAGDSRLASMTLLASLVDFSDPGELSVFISPSQLTLLEALMHKAGVLENERMAAAFTLLRSRDLLWLPAVNTYVRGERTKLTDLMAWNADGTRMPWRMHTEYLDRLYLRNELARGTFTVGAQHVGLAAVRIPMFVVGTESDHVTPWRSVYSIRNLTRSEDYTFVLTSGGHNAGIVSGPEHPKRRHRVLSLSYDARAPAPDNWLHNTPPTQGSWWPAWQKWLAAHSDSEPQNARPTTVCADAEQDLGDAPGEYVHE